MNIDIVISHGIYCPLHNKYGEVYDCFAACKRNSQNGRKYLAIRWQYWESFVFFFFYFTVAPVQRMYHDPSDRPASYNDLPHPEGDWRENYNKKQSKYNATLAGATVFLVATIAYVSHFPLISIIPKIDFINWRVLHFVFADQRVRSFVLQCVPTRYLRIRMEMDLMKFSRWIVCKRPRRIKNKFV